MKELEASFVSNNGVWAVVTTTGGKYIGELRNCNGASPLDSELYDPQIKMRLYWPMEFVSQLIPVSVRDPRTGQEMMALNRHLEAAPIGHLLDIEKTDIIVHPVDLILFRDMSRSDREWHMNLVRAAVKNITALRLREAGIIDPGARHISRDG